MMLFTRIMKTTLLSIVFMIFSIAVNGQSINEVMYDPVSNDGVGGEYIELYGTPGTDIGCYMVSDGDWVVVIPNGTTIPADGFFVIANAPLVDGDSTDVDLDVSTCACNSDPNNYITLTNSGEFVALFDNAGNILDGIIFEENVVGNSNAPSGQVLTPTNPGLCTNGDLTIPSLANLTSPPAPWSYLGDNVVDGSIDVVPDGSDGWGDSSTQGVMGNSMGATNAVASCSITAITLNNISACNNLGTADSTDDQFTYDVTVTYNNAPSTGNLLIRLYDANGTQISAHPIAFDPNQTSVTVTDLIAGTIDIADLTITAVAQFSADATCQITNTNAGTSPAPCSVACGLGSFLGVDCLDQGTECNSDDVISLRVNASNSGAGPTNQYNVIIAGTTYGPYDYDVQNLIPISPLLSASESVTITDVDNNACTSTNNIPLNGCSAYDQPPISVSSNSPLCEKETIMLFEAGGAANVTWAWTGPLGFTSSDQNPTIANATPAHSGDYDVIVTAPGGCTSTQTTTVTVNPLPVVDITTPDTSVCDSSGSFQIAATPAGGVFSGPNVSSTGEFDADAASAGTYSIVYSYQDPATRCTNTDTINITVTALPVVTAGG
ncbi:MAG TPA: lamin tail domain-containing protein [Saprospiraceae bacterium]|nr:lamin tail domain-containing protein [Saprospiraceae bacterium]